MKDYLIYYCEKDSKKLKDISNYIILRNFPWLPQKDYDDFYSIAGEVLWDCCKKFEENKGIRFETYLINCVTRKFKTRVTYMNRQRRNNGDMVMSLDALIDDNDTCLINLIATNKDNENTLSDKMISYINKLSKQQKQILFLMVDGFTGKDIKRILKITDTEFFNAISAIKSYRNISLLF